MTKVARVLLIIDFHNSSSKETKSPNEKIPNIFSVFDFGFFTHISSRVLLKMAQEDPTLTHRPAQTKTVPSRADEVSNVRFLCLQLAYCGP